jgi:hypothetical protein
VISTNYTGADIRRETADWRTFGPSCPTSQGWRCLGWVPELCGGRIGNVPAGAPLTANEVAGLAELLAEQIDRCVTVVTSP